MKKLQAYLKKILNGEVAISDLSESVTFDILEQIAKDATVKERVRKAIANALEKETIALSYSQKLQKILVKHFC